MTFEKQIIISAPQEKIVSELLVKYCQQKECELLFSDEKIKLSKSIFNKKHKSPIIKNFV